MVGRGFSLAGSFDAMCSLDNSKLIFAGGWCLIVFFFVVC